MSTPAAGPPTVHCTRTAAVRTSTFAALIAGALFLSGCAMPSVANMSPDLSKRAGNTARPAAAATPGPAVAPIKTPTPQAVDAASTSAENITPQGAVPAPDRGDLKAGSLTRSLAAGDAKLVINYWTDANPATLSAASPTVIQLAAHMENSDGLHAVKVSRFLATLDDGTTVTTVSDDQGEFVLTPPYSYGTALTLRPGNHATTMVTLSVEFDLLVETSPGSGAFFRQTVLDNVRIALSGQGVAS